MVNEGTRWIFLAVEVSVGIAQHRGVGGVNMRHGASETEYGGGGGSITSWSSYSSGLPPSTYQLCESFALY
jgi:hypothetical protein